MSQPPTPFLIKLNLQFTTYEIEVLRTGTESFGITARGLASLYQALNYTFFRIQAQPPEERFNYALQYLVEAIQIPLLPIQDGVRSFRFELVRDPQTGILVIIFNRFYYRTATARKEGSFWVTDVAQNSSASWPTYQSVKPFIVTPQRIANNSKIATTQENFRLTSGASLKIHNTEKKVWNFQNSLINPDDNGLIRFTPEFNVDSSFNNANFFTAPDDNFEDNIQDFINSPAINKAMWILPKLNGQKKNCGCKHCTKKKQVPSTSVADLSAMIISIYQTVSSLQQGTITFEEATLEIDSILENFEKYVVKGARNIFYFTVQDNFIYLVLVKRYNLLQSDCVVAFNLQTGSDFLESYDKIIMGVSEVPVDEDMSEAIYNPNRGLFFYLNGDQTV
jgi:hypothetical protein